VGFGSFDVRWTVSVVPVVTFQNWSVALTMVLNAVPAVCAVGEPLLPLDAGAPGAFDSPGRRTCSLFVAPATIESVPKFVVPFVMPVIAAVPPVRTMLPAVIVPPPLTGWTWRPATVT